MSRPKRIFLYLSVVLAFYLMYFAVFVVDWFDIDGNFSPTLESHRAWREYEERYGNPQKKTPPSGAPANNLIRTDL